MLNAPVCPALTSPKGRLTHSCTSQMCVMKDLVDSKKVAPTGESRSNQVVGSLSQNICTQIMSETGQTERGFAMKEGCAECIDNVHPHLQTGWLNVKLADKYNMIFYFCDSPHLQSFCAQSTIQKPSSGVGGRKNYSVFSLNWTVSYHLAFSFTTLGKTSILTWKTAKDSKEDWTSWFVRLDHYDSCSRSETSKALFPIPLFKWWVETETFLLSLFNFMLCGFMLKFNLLVFIAQV